MRALGKDLMKVSKEIMKQGRRSLINLFYSYHYVLAVLSPGALVSVRSQSTYRFRLTVPLPTYVYVFVYSCM